MKVEERDIILETVDTLRLLGGNNGFSNLQPKIKKLLLSRANELKAIVENDIRGGQKESEPIQSAVKEEELEWEELIETDDKNEIKVD